MLARSGAETITVSMHQHLAPDGTQSGLSAAVENSFDHVGLRLLPPTVLWLFWESKKVGRTVNGSVVSWLPSFEGLACAVPSQMLRTGCCQVGWRCLTGAGIEDMHPSTNNFLGGRWRLRMRSQSFLNGTMVEMLHILPIFAREILPNFCNSFSIPDFAIKRATFSVFGFFETSLEVSLCIFIVKTLEQPNLSWPMHYLEFRAKTLWRPLCSMSSLA